MGWYQSWLTYNFEILLFQIVIQVTENVTVKSLKTLILYESSKSHELI